MTLHAAIFLMALLITAQRAFPVETGPIRAADLVDLATQDPTIPILDIPFSAIAGR